MFFFRVFEEFWFKEGGVILRIDDWVREIRVGVYVGRLIGVV